MRLVPLCLGIAALAALALSSFAAVGGLPGIVAPALAAGSSQALEGSLVADLGALSTALLVAVIAIVLATAIWAIDRTSRRQRGGFDNRNPRYRVGGLVHPCGPTGTGGRYDPG